LLDFLSEGYVAVLLLDHDETHLAINAAYNTKPDDVIYFQFDKKNLVNTIITHLRNNIAKRIKLIPEYKHDNQFNFL